MKKFLTRWQEIEVVEVERETESCVWLNGIRHRKRSDFESFHDTFEQAKAYIVRVAEMEVIRKKFDLADAELNLQRAQNVCEKTI